MSEITTWYLVKSILRPENGTQTEIDDSSQACQWLNHNLTTLEKVVSEEEKNVLQTINAYFLTYRQAPTFTLLEAAQREGIVGGKGLFLDEYKVADAGGELVRQAPGDLPALLAMLVKAHRDDHLSKVFQNGATIATIGVDPPGKGGEKVRLQGADDAIQYVLARLDRDAIRQGLPPTRVSSSGDPTLRQLWEAALAPDDRDKITSGITTIDERIPLRKGQLVGLLGHAGQGKSTLARTIAYNAAMSGASVLTIPLELEVGEEVAALAIIHALKVFPDESRRLKVTKAAQYQRQLSPEARSWLSGVRADFEAQFDGQGGRGIIRVARPAAMTLDAVMALIDQEHAKHAIDVVCIDYPRCLRLPGKNPRPEAEDMVAHLKDLAAHFDSGHRLLVLAPIQSNRAGYETAKKNGGAWEMSAVLEDSAYERYADLILGVYRDEDLDDEGKVRLSTPKVRNGAPIPPWDLRVDRAGRFFYQGNPPLTAIDLVTLDVLEVI